MSITENLKFDEKGLIPAIAQHYLSGKALMLAYMNAEAFEKTLETKKAAFFSRSRQELWTKGETSGNFLEVRGVRLDCDSDAVLLLVEPKGPACHTGAETCFFTGIENGETAENGAAAKLSVLQDVYGVIAGRKANPKEGSYTNYLFEKGIDKILKKVGEEAAEVIIASKNPDTGELVYEASDLLYHLMVTLVERGLGWEELCDELAKRR
jgi:phosphoribosyl-ATP pyrophosphohydrolase/phosphoribosyl-AMP cyclohydrolase